MDALAPTAACFTLHFPELNPVSLTAKNGELQKIQFNYAKKKIT
jgi:hypothetical protein